MTGCSIPRPKAECVRVCSDSVDCRYPKTYIDESTKGAIDYHVSYHGFRSWPRQAIVIHYGYLNLESSASIGPRTLEYSPVHCQSNVAFNSVNHMLITSSVIALAALRPLAVAAVFLHAIWLYFVINACCE